MFWHLDRCSVSGSPDACSLHGAAAWRNHLEGGPLAASPLPAIAPTGKRENTAFGEALCVKLLLSPFGERRETCRWT